MASMEMQFLLIPAQAEPARFEHAKWLGALHGSDGRLRADRLQVRALKLPKMNDGDVVRVRWRDHFYDEDPQTVDEFTDECVHTTVGVLVRATADLISVSPMREELDGKVKWSRTQHIYRALIVDEPEVLTGAVG